MQNAPEHSAILLTFIKLPFVLSIFEWPLKTGFTVYIPISGLPSLFACNKFRFSWNKAHIQATFGEMASNVMFLNHMGLIAGKPDC